MDAREASGVDKVPSELPLCVLLSWCFYLVISRWEEIPALQVRLCWHAAVRVPGYGILAIGGGMGWSREDVEMLQLSGEDEGVTSWRRMAPMLKWKYKPSACYLGGFVYVCSRYMDNLDLELFDVTAGATGQWTQIACQFSFRGYRNLLALSGSLWLIGDFNAPSTSQPTNQHWRVEFGQLNLFSGEYLLQYSILELRYIISIGLIDLVVICLN